MSSPRISRSRASMPRLSQVAPALAGETAAASARSRYMLEPLVAGLLAGWGVAIPLGAIGVMIVDLGMRGGLRPAAAAAAGAAVAGALAEHERALRLVAAAVLVAVAAIGLRMALRAPGDESGPAAVAAAAPGGRAVYLRF